jgi:hypothetical protein
MRNIRIQPGPLARPPKARSLRSFRIVDFGRAKKHFPLVCTHELEEERRWALEELKLDGCRLGWT